MKTHLSLEEVAGGLFTGLSRNRTLFVDLPDQIVEDLRTQTCRMNPSTEREMKTFMKLSGNGKFWLPGPDPVRFGGTPCAAHLVDVDLALGRSLQKGTRVPLAGEADPRLFGYDALHLQVTFVSNQDHGNLEQKTR